MNRWEVAPPYEWLGAWEGRLMIAYDYDTKTDVCGHLHRSANDAERCAQELTVLLNAQLTPFGPGILRPMPPDYYLG